MHVHVPLIIEVIGFAVIALYFIIYKLLLRKRLSPRLASLIANANGTIIYTLAYSTIMTFPFMAFGLIYFVDYIAIPIVFIWFFQPVLIMGALYHQPPSSRYYQWAQKKQLIIIGIVFCYIVAFLGILKKYKIL